MSFIKSFFDWKPSSKPECAVNFVLFGYVVRLFYFRYRPKAWRERDPDYRLSRFVIDGPTIERRSSNGA